MKTIHSRREFLKVSAAGTIGAFAVSRNQWEINELSAAGLKAADPKSFGIGLQLYTIREAMGKDAPGSLKEVSDAGYKYVELADYVNRKFYGYEPVELKKIVNDLGMEILSSHASVKGKG